MALSAMRDGVTLTSQKIQELHEIIVAATGISPEDWTELGTHSGEISRGLGTVNGTNVTEKAEIYVENARESITRAPDFLEKLPEVINEMKSNAIINAPNPSVYTRIMNEIVEADGDQYTPPQHGLPAAPSQKTSEPTLPGASTGKR